MESRSTCSNVTHIRMMNRWNRIKFTSYYLNTRTRPDREWIEFDWVRQAVENPIRQMTQSDGRIRRWARIREADDRVLRVVLLADGETVHNAFFDRSFREAE